MIICDIVIIDSGLNQNKTTVVPGISIQKTEDDFTINDNITDEIGHGTIMYNIIHKQSPHTQIFIVKISEHDDNGEDYLIAALKYIYHNIKCKLINISLGIKTGNNLNELYRICHELATQGTVLVAAFDNEGCYSYPATFNCVIGVDCKNDLVSVAEFDFVEGSPINILAKGNIQRLTLQDGKMLLVGGSSIACGHITAILANASSGWSDYHSALHHLKATARYTYSSHMSERPLKKNKIFKINNAAVFPFTKETHAFLRFADTLSFHIHRYYDIKRSGNVGRKLTDFFENACTHDTILDIEAIDFEGIDTIILGHLDKINALLKRDYRQEIILKAIDAGVNIYSFDPLDHYAQILDKATIKVYYPEVTQYDVPENTFGKLYKVPSPVVGIFGTSSQQGKFSLQIELKKQLEYLNYNVGTVGTEPHSLLFNLDVVFPMGYNSTVYLNSHEIILYLNNEINKLCLQGKEIILTATQAQTVPYYFNNLLEFPSKQYPFALGTNPDAIILCINHYDEIEYIRNSMCALKGLTDASVIALVMYPITYTSDWNGVFGKSKYRIDDTEFKEKAEILQKEFQIPVYMLGNPQHINKLCQGIIDFF